MNMQESAALYERACKSLALGVSSGMRSNVTKPPLYIERADGPFYYDADHHKLIDYTLAWGPLIIGSNHAGINQAVIEQLSRGYTYGCQHRIEIELAELMVDVLPGVEQVIFANTGTEAVQVAIRIARTQTGRDKFIKFEGHYHGWMNNVLVNYHPTEGDAFTTQPGCGGQPASEYAETIVLPWNDLTALEQAFEKYPDQISCVITEPILANSGSCMPEDGYLAGLIALCHKHGTVSIFDEVITGFRVALGGAREYFNLEPDLSVYGKALAGGFTMSAVGGRTEMFDVLREGKTIHAGTYNGTSFNLIAARETIKALREPGVYEQMNQHGESICNALGEAAVKYSLKLATSGVGPVFSAHFGVDEAPRNYRDTLKTDMNLYTRFRSLMLQKGVQLLPDCRWYVGATHNDDVLAQVLPAIEESIKEIQQ